MFTRQCLMYNFLFPHPINDRVHAKLKFCRFCNARKSSRSFFTKKERWEVPYVYEMKYVYCLNYQNCERILERFSMLHWNWEAQLCGTFQSWSDEHPMIMRIEWNDINIESFISPKLLSGCFTFYPLAQKMVHSTNIHFICYAWKCHEKDVSSWKLYFSIPFLSCS